MNVIEVGESYMFRGRHFTTDEAAAAVFAVVANMKSGDSDQLVARLMEFWERRGKGKTAREAMREVMSVERTKALEEQLNVLVADRADQEVELSALRQALADAERVAAEALAKIADLTAEAAA